MDIGLPLFYCIKSVPDEVFSEQRFGTCRKIHYLCGDNVIISRKVKKIIVSSIILIALANGFRVGAQEVIYNVPQVFHDEAFELTLASSALGFDVYYTLDGTRPTRRNAVRYAGPIEIRTTTPVSAVCIGANDSIGPVSTRTFIFLEDVYRQPAAPEGYPNIWSKKDASSYWAADYAMDTTITLGETYGALMDSAMRSIPTVCLVTDIDYLFSQSEDPEQGGIYVHTGKDLSKLGDGWERPASIEYIDPKTGESFQRNCGLLLHGGNSRNPSNTPKHSFRVSFRKEYGVGKLRFNLFEDEDAVDHFDHLILRAGYNYTWLKNGSASLYPQNIVQRTDAQYILDSWAKEAHHAMGHLMTHRRFVHLYINGLYWGLYELCEKINDNFASDYLGGVDEDYDVVDVSEMIDGERSAYEEMYKVAMKVGTGEQDKYYHKLLDESLLDLENYIDYMLVNWYIGNDDWDHNNWRCIRSRVNPGRGFRYLVWDAETAFKDVEYDKVEKVKGDPTQMMKVLKKNPEFRRLMQERINLHLTGDGILTPEHAAALYESLADEIDLAIIGESARWGDYRKSTGETQDTYTRNDFWLKRKEELLTHYFPQRTEILLDHLEDYGLYDPSGITKCHVDEPVEDVRAYTLQGMPVREGYRGIAVKGGKLILKE